MVGLSAVFKVALTNPFLLQSIIYLEEVAKFCSVISIENGGRKKNIGGVKKTDLVFCIICCTKKNWRSSAKKL